MAKETRDVSTKGYRTSSDRRSRKGECSNNKKPRVGAENGATKERLYAMKIDRGRNCYSCGEFGHLAQNCRR